MQIYLTTFLFILFSNLSVSACSFAYQYSLYPLGMQQQDLVILETELERYVNTPASNPMMPPMGRPNLLDNTSMDVRWKGQLRLRILQGGTWSTIKDLGYIDISDDHYEEALQPYFKTALEFAHTLPFFEEAQLNLLGECKYDKTCTFFELSIDEEKAKFYCQLNKTNYPKKQEVKFPELTLLKFENMTTEKFSDIEKVETETVNDFYKIWSPYSVRKYQIGEREVLIYTLGWGQKQYYKKKKSAIWRDNLPPIEQFIEGKDVMRHGQRFDVLQVL